MRISEAMEKAMEAVEGVCTAAEKFSVPKCKFIGY